MAMPRHVSRPMDLAKSRNVSVSVCVTEITRNAGVIGVYRLVNWYIYMKAMEPKIPKESTTNVLNKAYVHIN